MRHIYYTLFLLILSFSFIGCAEDPSMPGNIINGNVPSLQTISPVENVKATEATVFGRIIAENGSSITSRGFIWFSQSNPDLYRNSSDLITIDPEDDKKFSVTMKSLENDQDYYVVSYAENKSGRNYGDTIAFSTTPGKAQVQTTKILERRVSSALVEAKITSKGEGEILERGFYYSLSSFSYGSSKIDSVVSEMKTDSFTCWISGLESNKTFFVKAYVKNQFGISTGAELSYTTTSGLPYFTVFEISDITDTEATIHAEINDADARVFRTGLYYGQTEEDKKSIDLDESNDFTFVITDAMPGREYFVTAYAENSYGIGYSDTLRFYLENDLPTIKTLNPVISNGFVNVKAEVLSHGNGTIQTAGFIWSTIPDPTLEMVDNKEVFRQNVWNGSNNLSFIISDNIKPSNLYYLRSYASNELDTSYGNVITFETPNIFDHISIFPGTLTVPADGASVKIGEDCYLVRGNNQPVDELWKYNIPSKRWSMINQIPEKRTRITAANTTTAIFAFGGLDSYGQATNDIFYCNIDNYIWQKTSGSGEGKPVPTYGAFGAITNELIIIGGIQMVDQIETVTNEVWTWNILNMNWEAKNDFPEAQYDGILLYTNRYLYAGLGMKEGGIGSKKLWVSRNIVDYLWEELAEMPGNGGAQAAVAIGYNYVYVVDIDGYIQQYNVRDNTWQTKSRLKESNREVHCMFVAGDFIYIGLGSDGKELLIYNHNWDK